MDRRLRVGELLTQAGLVTEAQLQVALQDQQASAGLYRLGEILAMRGWLEQETIEFFVKDINEVMQESSRLKIGEYLVLAKLLDRQQVDLLLWEQVQQNKSDRFGTMAVKHGWITQQTLDFLLLKLFPECCKESGLPLNRRDSRGAITELPDDPEVDVQSLLAEYGLAFEAEEALLVKE